MESHGTDRYSYGADCMPFCEKGVLVGMQSLFTRPFMEINNRTVAVQEPQNVDVFQGCDSADTAGVVVDAMVRS